MTALVVEALALAERHHITIALVGGDRLSWESRGPTPGRALKALRAAKAELVDLLIRYRWTRPALLPATTCSPRFGLQASPSAAMASCRARRRPRRRARSRPSDVSSLRLRRQTGRIQPRAPGAASAGLPRRTAIAELGRGRQDGRAGNSREAVGAVAEARDLIDQLRDLGFRAYLDHGALYFADTTGWRRDLFRFISPTLVFEVLNAGLDDDPALLDPREDSP